MSETKQYIYVLIDPITDQIRYVGRTIDPAARLKSHINEALYTTGVVSRKIKWISQLIDEGLRPRLEVIEMCTGDNSAIREYYWIVYYWVRCNDLLNSIKPKNQVCSIQVGLRITPRQARELVTLKEADPELTNPAIFQAGMDAIKREKARGE